MIEDMIDAIKNRWKTYKKYSALSNRDIAQKIIDLLESELDDSTIRDTLADVLFELSKKDGDEETANEIKNMLKSDIDNTSSRFGS
ncbi:hypothetical protein JJB07_00560 [Tumebacillus sp. ITR2]|uniref:Uncharacterized protein n=1 Tax=Tumebacillus amylolyticus TaxID=2801339 RepID=A0ABS1J4B4_9BACL|nr:hypothetical protein [Tumebacillus amylolyticus]MBL0385122.1 hypothetical protein [Tumebacillus amylolyticus]